MLWLRKESLRSGILKLTVRSFPRRANLWHHEIGEYPSVKELHYIEWSPNDIAILTETTSLWNRNVRLL